MLARLTARLAKSKRAAPLAGRPELEAALRRAHAGELEAAEDEVRACNLRTGPSVPGTLALGLVLEDQGRLALARRTFARALEIEGDSSHHAFARDRLAALPEEGARSVPDGRRTATDYVARLATLARRHEGNGERDWAESLLRRALAVVDVELTGWNATTAFVLRRLGELVVTDPARRSEGVALLERALALHVRLGLDPELCRGPLARAATPS